MDEIKLYAVRNAEGQWFRSKGYGGYGKTWVDEFRKARVYNAIGPARQQVTFFAKNYPEFGVPDLVELTVTSVTALDESDRVAKALGK